MIAVLASLGVAGEPEDKAGIDPARWSCAQRMIDRTYRQAVHSRALSELIAEQCAVAFSGSAADETALARERIAWHHRVTAFREEIERRIERARRLDVDLRRR
jgi:hypothetical protein